MKTLRKPTVLALALLALVPAFAAGRQACCVKKAAPAAHGCCAATAASAPKGCCKPPQAPKPEARAKAEVSPALLPAVAMALASAEIAPRATDAEVVLTARLDHRAPSPADSPPDLLTLHRALLI